MKRFLIGSLLAMTSIGLASVQAFSQEPGTYSFNEDNQLQAPSQSQPLYGAIHLESNLLEYKLLDSDLKPTGESIKLPIRKAQIEMKKGASDLVLDLEDGSQLKIRGAAEERSLLIKENVNQSDNLRIRLKFSAVTKVPEGNRSFVPVSSQIHFDGKFTENNGTLGFECGNVSALNNSSNLSEVIPLAVISDQSIGRIISGYKVKVPAPASAATAATPASREGLIYGTQNGAVGLRVFEFHIRSWGPAGPVQPLR